MLERIQQNAQVQYAVLVGVVLPKEDEVQVQLTLQELELLAQTVSVVSVKKFTQRLEKPHNKTFVGSGKLAEIKKYIDEHTSINMIIFDDDLSASQFSTIEASLKVRVVDRSMLILDIFAIHAKTARSKNQVEMAQYQYLLPRLRGMWKHLERQGGGIGTRGPGETELETDRRIVQQKIAHLKNKLKMIEQQGITQRKNRTGLLQVALCGYTNAGKTAIMNHLGKAQLVSQNKLFVTLDTTTRKISMPDCQFLLSDTVGFIQKTPHHLIESFRSTLEEVCTADILLHVVDISHRNSKRQFDVVVETLKSIGVKPETTTLVILNKVDLLLDQNKAILMTEGEIQLIQEELLQEWTAYTQSECILVSALKGTNMDTFRSALLEKVKVKSATIC